MILFLMIEIVKIVNKDIKMSLRIKIGIHLKIKPVKHLMKEILKNKMNSIKINFNHLYLKFLSLEK
jgi:hypothetical protein